MSKRLFLSEEELTGYSGLHDLPSTLSKEDVCTLVEVYEEVVKSIDYQKVSGVVTDDKGHYYFVVEGGTMFDLYGFIRNHGGFDVDCVDAKVVFPKSLSRGIYFLDEADIAVETEVEEEEDLPTSFLSDSLPSDRVYSISSERLGISVKIKNTDVVIGRSATKADFVIPGNSSVGRVHCRVYMDTMGNIKIHDENSLNGTFVNGERVKSDKDRVLVVGDVIKIANEELIVG